MASTLICHMMHIVFSTKERGPLIHADLAPRLYAYVGGVSRQRGCTLLAMGGIEDHVHILTTLHPNVGLAGFVRDIKSNSSRWMHEEVGVPRFAWQSGYSGFSVSKSNSATVARYIGNQRKHHAKKSFKEELIEFLERHEVEYDPRYVFD